METPRKVLRNKHLQTVINQLTPIRVPATPLLKQLGYGTGVNVYQLDRSPKNGRIQSPWAIKRVSKRAGLKDKLVYESRIKDEAEILRKLSHPNIVGFRSMLKTADGKENLAIECCNMSLYDLIETKREANDTKPLSAKHIFKVCCDITKALDYLHNVAKILHGDVKSPNVLVKGDFEICKLCDFGVSLPLDEQGELDLKKNPKAKYVGTDLWAAPEVIDGGIITDKCDMFSFGLIIYECIALIPPHTWSLLDKDDDDEEDDETDVDESMELDTSFGAALGTRPPLPETFELDDEYCQVVEIFFLCTNEMSEDRPSAKFLAEKLNK